MTKVYSRDEERFQDDLCEVLADLDGDGYLEPGATIYEADKVEYVASKFFRGGVDDIIETIRDQAWEEAGEFAESFAENITKEKLAELETLISNWLDANVRVNFFTVRNVKPVEVTEVMIADYRNAPASGVEAAPDMRDRLDQFIFKWVMGEDEMNTGEFRHAKSELLAAIAASGVEGKRNG